MKAKEFRKKYLGLQYNQVNSLTPFAIDEMLEAYHQSRVSAISDEDANDEFNRFEQQCLDNGKGFEPYEAFIRCFRWIKQTTKK